MPRERKDIMMMGTVITSIILLTGVIIMLYGYTYQNKFIIYFGIFITVIASVAIIILQIIIPHKMKKGLYSYREFGTFPRRRKLK